MVNSPTSSLVRMVESKLSNSASGIMASQFPQISKSCIYIKRNPYEIEKEQKLRIRLA